MRKPPSFRRLSIASLGVAIALFLSGFFAMALGCLFLSLLSLLAFGWAHIQELTEAKKDMMRVLQDLAAKKDALERASQGSGPKWPVNQSTQMLAHDMRKPLSLLQMALAQLAQEKDPIAMRDIVRRFVPAVEKALDSANRMIDDVMEFGHESDLHQEEVAPDALVESTVNSLFRVNKDSNILLSYDFQHSYKVKADSLKVLRVLQNIVENAIEAQPESGSIWFKTSEQETPQGRFVTFEIGNNGPSIPAGQIDRLFDPFYTKDKKGGTGLGLSIAQKIIKAHNGRLWCKSTEAEGTRFFFTLPSAPTKIDTLITGLPEVSGEVYFRFEAARNIGLSETNQAPQSLQDLQAAVARRLKRSGQRLRVLLIDDHPLYMTGLNAQIMQADGLEDVECSMASHGQEACDMAVAENPHLIICDVDMGARSIDGYDIVRKLRNAGLESLICMHSNHKSPADFATAKTAGADGFLPKPMSKDSLLKLLLAALPNEEGKPSGRRSTTLTPSTAEIALIDDCPFTLESWQQKLVGIKTHCFSSPQEFWQAHEELKLLPRLSCVITDYYFDDEEDTGETLARRIKQGFPQMPVFLASDAIVTSPAIDQTIGKMPISWQDLQKFIPTLR